MSKDLPKKKELISIAKEIKRKNEDVLDIVLIGSVVKGKEKGKDIDILLIFKKKIVTETAYALRKMIEKYFSSVEVIPITYEQLFSSLFKARSAYLSEGYSLVNEISIAEGMGFSNKMLFKYSLENFNQNQRMKLQYALYGRDKSGGVFKELALKKFSAGVILCPIENTEKLKEFFDEWKIKFEVYSILMSERKQ